MKENSILKIIIGLVLIILLVVGVIVILNLKPKKDTHGTTETPDSRAISESTNNDDFSFKFLKQESFNQNLIYSPLSIKYALNMLYEGANGNTKTQIENIIKNYDLTKYNNIDNVLSLANCIYVRDNYEQYIKEDFKESLINKYNSEVNYDTFDNANNINNWIEQKTLGIIKNMLEDSLVQDPNLEMLLINALAIDMEWQIPFDFSKTHGQDFTLANGNKLLATMMHKETSSDNIYYYKDKDITFLTMDLKEYDNTQLEFDAIMPSDNLTNYINNFSVKELNELKQKSKSASSQKSGINISIPKFSFDYNLNLKNDLIDLGITDAFNDEFADFDNMTSNPIGLYVSDALHKSNIDFSEKGIKAAAVTVMAMTNKMAMVDTDVPEEVNFDKPFIFVIRDKNNGEIWFVGTVYEPNSWEKDKQDYKNY